MCVGIIILFFRQKTAYEMRISDWSSDVCSSDLGTDCRPAAGRRQPGGGHREGSGSQEPPRGVQPRHCRHAGDGRGAACSGDGCAGPVQGSPVRRSEEHTSELQSLMRISYAVFCLIKKIEKTHVRSNVTKAQTVCTLCYVQIKQ